MSSLSRPSPTLSTAELFTSWLPAAFVQARAAGAAPPDAVVVVELSGADGGAWTLRVAGGALAVTAGTEAGAALVLRQSVADFRAAIWGEGEVPPLLPEEVDLAEALAGQAKVPFAQLAAVAGTLVLEIPEVAGRTWTLALCAGGAAAPSATVRLDLPTIAALRAGTLPVSTAFFSGKIAVTGDVPWLMQVGMSLAASLGGM